MDTDLILGSIARHIRLSDEETRHFLTLLRHKTIEAGDYLLREGQICKEQYFVCRGCLKSFYTDSDGVDHLLDFSIEGWWAEDLHSMFTGTPSKTSIQAIERTEVWVIDTDALATIYRTLPQFERFFRLSFQNAYIAQRERIIANLSVPAEDRYTTFLARFPYAESRFLLKDVASYLGITPQFLSVIRRKKKAPN
ncbi:MULTISPECIES: Crp/Fnr family transcriptional regulator [unclassified Flavobacterium]|uniref:Crp/Fnr family transcriptional regulator n=1 Tax=unclassified Flavobacterium TaxID=196869 RepID=UPI001F12FD2B|nr:MULTISPECIES: Crp/Fnr family transcriptional regulator [unclassified Flavobacterium]UMY66905.1 Crp/Fnr family transcriptional regulator [Flavobacterium sp. HJ-32-4]